MTTEDIKSKLKEFLLLDEVRFDAKPRGQYFEQSDADKYKRMIAWLDAVDNKYFINSTLAEILACQN